MKAHMPHTWMAMSWRGGCAPPKPTAACPHADRCDQRQAS